MPDDTATAAIAAATEAARVDILAAIDAMGPGTVGHGAIRLLDRAEPPPAAAPAAAEPAPAETPAPAPPPERAGHGTIRLRGSTP